MVHGCYEYFMVHGCYAYLMVHFHPVQSPAIKFNEHAEYIEAQFLRHYRQQE